MNENEKKTILIDGIEYSQDKPLIIAELGTSHNGDINRAKEMIDAAAQTAADCVKFQIVFADEILHPNTGEVALPGGKIKLFDRFKTLESQPEFFSEVKEYAESRKLLFLCTPFGPKSASILKDLRPHAVKIASPELNYTGLLKEIAGWGLPVLLSSGVSKLSDIETALEILKSDTVKTEKKRIDFPQICLLHCVTAYPAPETDYNLKILPSLSAVFGVSAGVSDHSCDSTLVPALAVCMGACVIEKHFCLSRNDPGLDDPIALPPDEFSLMVKAVRQAASAGPEKTLDFYRQTRGVSLVDKILGSGIKELAPSEKTNYRFTNRSVHALRDIEKGEIFKKGDYAALRTEKNLRPGLEPFMEDAIEGRIARNSIPAGEGIRLEDI